MLRIDQRVLIPVTLVGLLGVGFLLKDKFKDFLNKEQKLPPTQVQIETRENTKSGTHLSQLEIDKLEFDALRELAKKLGQNDPQRGVALLNELEGDALRIFAETFFQAWAEVAPEACFLCVSNLWKNNDLVFVNDAESVAAIWASQAPQEAAEAIQELILNIRKHSSFHASYLLVAVLDEWSDAAPEEAFRWLRKMPEDLTDGVGLTAVIQNWAKVDPLNALATSQDKSMALGDRSLVYEAGLSEWSRVDPLQSSQWFLKNIDTKDLPYLEQAASMLSQNFFDQSTTSEVVDWIEKIPEGKVKESAIVALAAQWGNGNRPEEDILDIFVEQSQQSGDPIYGRGLYEASHSLASHAPRQVAEWLNKQENFSPDTDQVIDGFLSSSAEDIPFDVLFQWSGKITEPDLQARQQSYLLRRLRSSDETVYQRWLEENREQLPPSTQALLVR